VASIGLAISFVGLLATAQTTPRSLFSLVRPDATIIVRKHELGADLVQITMLDEKYPLEALKAQCEEMCSYLGQQPRGLYVFAFNLGSTQAQPTSNMYVRATFAVDGLTEPSTGEFKLGPIVKAMVHNPPGHELGGLMIQFEGMNPGDATIRSLGTDRSPVAVEGRYSGPHVGLEYRVAIRTHNPSEVVIPDKLDQGAAQPTVLEVKSQPPFGALAGVLVASLFIGALVYFFVLRKAPGTRR